MVHTQPLGCTLRSHPVRCLDYLNETGRLHQQQISHNLLVSPMSFRDLSLPAEWKRCRLVVLPQTGLQNLKISSLRRRRRQQRRESEVQKKGSVNSIESDRAPPLTPESGVQPRPTSCCSPFAGSTIAVMSPKNAKTRAQSPRSTPLKCHVSKCQLPPSHVTLRIKKKMKS